MHLLAIALLLLAPGAALAMSPTETVKVQVDQAVQVLSQSPAGTPAASDQRNRGIREAAEGLFDFTEMSRRALGQHWRGRTAAERDEFVKLFRDLMARAYLGKIDRYGGEAVTYVAERVDGDLAAVQSRFVTENNSEVPIEYRLHRLGDRWAAYDVLIENVSLVGTYRSQFDRIIKTGSFNELLAKMRQKEQEAVAEKPR